MPCRTRIGAAIVNWAGALFSSAVLLGASGQLFGQDIQERRAQITGNPNDTRGKCTVEVVVDAVAEIEIRGDMAAMRNLGGQPPRWVRFQCSAPMPIVPLNFRFSGVDGRGDQSLVRPPVNGDAAVIRIEDRKGGAEGYKFDIEWNGAGAEPRSALNRGGQFGGPGGFGNNRGGFGRDDRGGNFNRRLTTEEAIRTCEDAIIDQALDRLRVSAIVIRRTAIDDGPGRRDWVIGNFEVRQGRDRDRDRDTYRFQCSVDFDSGRVRSADFQPAR